GKSMLTPQAQAMMRQMPQTFQADPRLAIIEQMTKSGVLPKAGEQLQFQTDLMKIYNSAQQRGWDRENKREIAELLGKTSDRRNQALILRQVLAGMDAKDRAQIMADAWKYRADKQLAGVTKRVDELKDRYKTGGSQDKSTTAALKAL